MSLKVVWTVHVMFIAACVCSSGGLILARNLGGQNMKRYHVWNLSNQDISNKVRT